MYSVFWLFMNGRPKGQLNTYIVQCRHKIIFFIQPFWDVDKKENMYVYYLQRFAGAFWPFTIYTFFSYVSLILSLPTFHWYSPQATTCVASNMLTLARYDINTRGSFSRISLLSLRHDLWPGCGVNLPTTRLGKRFSELWNVKLNNYYIYLPISEFLKALLTVNHNISV
jgi:hypothetical protein